MKPVIHSRKHIVQSPFDGILTGTAQNIVLATVVDRTIADAATEIVEGAHVKAIFIEMWLQNSSNDGHAVVILEKVAQARNGATLAEMADLDSYANKKNVLFIHEGLTSNDAIGNPIPIMNSWFTIPKSKQRFSLGDGLILTISNPSSNTLNRCGKMIYKEYT